MSEKDAYEALSSKSRLQILKVLYRKPLSVNEISKVVSLKPITVRHHLQWLNKGGFIESFEEKGGTAGRPKVYYQIAKEPTVVVYPKRRYLELCAFLIETLKSSLGPKRTDEILTMVGENFGKSVVKDLESKYEIKEWTPEVFIDFFVKGYLEEVGSEPEILEKDENRVIYSVHNCLFLELSHKIPETICDVLHEAFHRGVANSIAERMEITRVTCMGHGDDQCRHECMWYPSL